jgi:hypothetical protein
MSHEEAQSVVVRSEKLLHILMAAGVVALLFSAMILAIPDHFGVELPQWAVDVAYLGQLVALALMGLAIFVAGRRSRAFFILARAS